ncbi:MAG: glycosyltransferase family A protein [Gammaproteobacteria bacterium]|nr:glycosyltransferase family A protein [Gammaproteobacteria bacterium]
MPDSIAVIIPIYNRCHTLGRALQSVYGQTLPPDEVCVVDDGSDDGSRDFVRQHFPQARYIYQPNAGVSAARNSGVQATQSHWLAFLDSDDEWLPNKLERQLEEAALNPDCGFVHCDEIWIRNGRWVNPMNKHQKSGGEIFEQCLPRCVISPSAAVITRALFEEMGGFDESFPACEDYDLWLKICSRYPVLYLNQALLKKYGGHEDQLSGLHWGMDRFRVKALDNLLGSAKLSPGQYQATRRTLISKSEILVQGALKRNNTETAKRFQALINKYSDVESAEQRDE